MLLTEIAFAHNIVPMSVLDDLSPFNLVFGRKPRLSAVDVCFPQSALPLPLPDAQEARRHINALHRNLEGMCFRALDATIESKEIMREQHDRKRANGMRTKTDRSVQVGDIVSVCRAPPIPCGSSPFNGPNLHFLC